MTLLIVTLGTVIMLLISILAAGLAFLVLEKAFRIFRTWNTADEEERHELEKEFYLAYAVVYIVFGIRIFAVPLYFWTMQTLVPTIPGAMCLWGIFNALPALCWSTLALKFALPVLYSGWLILANINNRCRKNPLIRNLMGLYIALSPLLVADSLLDLTIFSRLNPVQVTCCTSAIDIWPRPIPPIVGGISGQMVLFAALVASSLAYAFLSHISSQNLRVEWLTRLFSIALVPISVFATTEALTPWILNLPLHHCPFCLFYKAPTSVTFLATLWFSMAVPWWTLLMTRLAKADKESSKMEYILRGKLWTAGALSILTSLVLIVTHLAVALA